MIRLKKYEHTIYASYIGYITQAIVNNFAPLLFLTFSKDFNLTLDKITFITTINFAVQLLVDLLAAKYVDKIGYRCAVVTAHTFSAAGLLGIAFLPGMFSNPYYGDWWVVHCADFLLEFSGLELSALQRFIFQMPELPCML